MKHWPLAGSKLIYLSMTGPDLEQAVTESVAVSATREQQENRHWQRMI